MDANIPVQIIFLRQLNICWNMQHNKNYKIHTGMVITECFSEGMRQLRPYTWLNPPKPGPQSFVVYVYFINPVIGRE